MDVLTETSLQALLQRATDSRNKSTDTAAIDAFCGIIKKEPDGPQIASKLIAARIQSSQEWEALQGLMVLEACMKNCGSPFHSEIGKFRFLNEMIKLVSPKFLGPKTPPSVRNQVLKIIQDWTVEYPKEHKIKEAYDMLIKQGVIQKNEAIHLDDELKSFSQLSQKVSPLFQDEEKGKLLKKLLQSKNPDDLQAANKLIKAMVKEDEKRVEIKSKKINEILTIKDNVKLLNEMLDSYQLSQSSSEELDLMEELYEGCKRLKLNLIKMASDTHDSDDILCQVLSVGDELDQVLGKYKELGVLDKKLKSNSNLIQQSQESSLLDLSSPVEELPFTMDNTTVCKALSPCSSVSPSTTTTTATVANDKSDQPLNLLDAVFSSLNAHNGITGSSPIHFDSQKDSPVKLDKSIEKKNSKLKALEELDFLGATLLQQCKVNSVVSKASNEDLNTLKSSTDLEPFAEKNAFDSTARNEDSPLISIQSEDSALISVKSEDTSLISVKSEEAPTDINLNVSKRMEEGSGGTCKKEVKSLSDLSVSLESITPSSLPTLNLIQDKNGISITVHMAKDTPREDVTVYVISTTNKNPFAMTNYLLQAVVPKDCKLKLQKASGSELPPHNPFLPPSLITQIMLIANPNNVSVTLKCMISYTMENETFTEMGEIEELPKQNLNQ